MGNALTYLMNAVFVLMTTNYTLNPSFYFLGAQSTNSDGSNSTSYQWMAFFPLF